MLFWLGSIKFETPFGRFILTGAREVFVVRRRLATKEEASEVWRFLETQLTFAPPHELYPLYELYQELTSERFNGPHGEPHITLVLDAVRHALWANQLHFEFEEPFEPLREPEWEPQVLKDLVKRVQSSSPSELWGRRDSAPAPEVHFKVRLVDETEQAIPDICVTFSHAGSSETETTDGSGVAEYASSGASTATVSIELPEKLDEILLERWQQFRSPRLLEEAEVSRRTLHEAERSTTLTDAKPHTIQIVPELGCIYLELMDKNGRVRSTNCPYQIAGPDALSGTTDEAAQGKHGDVFPGKYTLTLELDGRNYTTVAVVQPAGASATQIRKLGVVRRSIMASVHGFVFEKNKAFVMPAAIESIREVRDLFFSTSPSDILVVGHADTTADAKTNDPLSLSRADCSKALLLGDIDAWLDMFGTSTLEKHRWGSREDGLMIAAMPDYATRAASEGPVYWYQRTRGLKQDGDCGKNTRTKLIEEYMALVGKPLNKDTEFTSPLTTHGCGENFPLDESGEELDANAKDGKDDAGDRRVEFFFFDSEYGIVPPATAKNSKPGSTEYPQWREGVADTIDLEVPEPGSTILQVRLHAGNGNVLGSSAQDPDDDAPKETTYRATIKNVARPEKETSDGWTRIIVPPGDGHSEVVIDWGVLDENGKYPYQRTVIVLGEGATHRQVYHAVLHNLGYCFDIDSDEEYDLSIRAFQQDYLIENEQGLKNRRPPPATRAKLNAIRKTCDATLPADKEVQAVAVSDPPSDLGVTPISPIEDDSSDSDDDAGDDPPLLSMRVPQWTDPNTGVIQSEYVAAAGGDNNSPAIEWDPPSKDVKSYAVVMHDSSANECLHWVAFDITSTSLAKNVGSSGLKLGQNTFGKNEYYGPEPPPDATQHCFVIQTYALDALGLLDPAVPQTLDSIGAAFEGHVLASAGVSGMYP